MNVREINKLLWDLEIEMSSGFRTWHDLEIALCRKRELEKMLEEIISSPKPMKKAKKVNKLKGAKTAKAKKAIKKAKKK